MIGLKASKKDADRARRYLAKHALLDNHYKIYGDNSFIYLPIIHGTEDKTIKSAAKKLGAKITKTSFLKVETASTYRQLLKKKLGKKYGEVTKSYDIIGNIALIDAKGESAKKMAEAIMSTNKNVETVISKAGAVSGKYRTRKYRHVAGKRNFIATYKENGAVLKFDIRKTFFSSRLAFDRLRIAKLVKKGENVVVMFAGMGPYVVEIAKMQREAKVVGMELSKSAAGYMKNNIELNHLRNATAELGDVNRLSSKHKGYANRIIMPLPNSAYDFLGAALKMAAKGCVVHYYGFGAREGAFEEHIKKVGGFVQSHKRKFRLLGKRVVRQYSPREIEIVLDFRVD